MLEFLNSTAPNNIFFIVIIVCLCMKVSGIGPWLGLVYVVSLCYLAKKKKKLVLIAYFSAHSLFTILAFKYYEAM